MDSIKLIITEPKEGPFKPISTVDVEVLLNDKVLCHNLFNTSSVMAGVKFDVSKFYLFTCSCGEPGCAGLHEEVEQTLKGDTVTWRFPPDAGYKTDKELYHFDKKEFELEFSRLQLELLRLEKENIHSGSMVSTSNGNEVFGILEHMLWCEDLFQKEIDTALFFRTEFAELDQKSFVFTYGTKKGQFDYSLQYMVKRILNSHNENFYNLFYRARCKYVVQTIVRALEGDMEGLLYIASRYHERCGCTVFDMVSHDLRIEDDKESEFDIKLLGIKIDNP